jgi:hypothetical protein
MVQIQADIGSWDKKWNLLLNWPFSRLEFEPPKENQDGKYPKKNSFSA